MRIKIIIHSGIVTEVLADGPAEVGSLTSTRTMGTMMRCAHEEVSADKELKPVDFVTAHFYAG